MADVLRVTPFEDSYLDRFADLVGALATGDTETERLVKVVANPGYLGSTKPSNLSLKRAAGIYARDSYTCRYCGRRTIALPVLNLVSYLFGGIFKVHPAWKTSETDAAYLVVSTTVDHVVPVTRGGDNDPQNLVTACWMCNSMKSNYLSSELPKWGLKPPAGTPWRGFTEFVEAMISLAGLQGNRYWRTWKNAIRNPEPLVEQSSKL